MVYNPCKCVKRRNLLRTKPNRRAFGDARRGRLHQGEEGISAELEDGTRTLHRPDHQPIPLGKRPAGERVCFFRGPSKR